MSRTTPVKQISNYQMQPKRLYDDDKVWDYLLKLTHQQKEKVVDYMIIIHRSKLSDASLAAEHFVLKMDEGTEEEEQHYKDFGRDVHYTPQRPISEKKVPQPRLVGIETNPGPTLPKNSKAAKRTPNANRNNRKKKQVLKKMDAIVKMVAKSKPNLMSLFTKSVRDPFNYAPPLLGAGTLIPLTPATAFIRKVITFAAASNNMMILLRPTIISMITTLIQPVSATAFSAGTIATYDAANMTTISTRFQTGRIISGGIRLRVLTPATNSQPVVFGGNIYDSYTNVVALSPATITNESQLKPSLSSSNGIEVTYRYPDLSWLSLSGTTVSGASSFPVGNSVPQSVLYVSIPTACTIVIDAVFHLEGNSGIDVGDEADEESLADQGISLESIARAAIAAGETVTDVLNTASIVLDNVRNRPARRMGDLISGASAAIGAASNIRDGWVGT